MKPRNTSVCHSGWRAEAWSLAGPQRPPPSQSTSRRPLLRPHFPKERHRLCDKVNTRFDRRPPLQLVHIQNRQGGRCVPGKAGVVGGALLLDATPPGDECGHCVAVGTQTPWAPLSLTLETVSSSGKESEKGDTRLWLCEGGSSGGGQRIRRGFGSGRGPLPILNR